MCREEVERLMKVEADLRSQLTLYAGEKREREKRIKADKGERASEGEKRGGLKESWRGREFTTFLTQIYQKNSSSFKIR